MKKGDLNKSDVMMIFRRVLTTEQMESSLREDIAKTVGEVIEENNRILAEDLINIIKNRRNN